MEPVKKGFKKTEVGVIPVDWKVLEFCEALLGISDVDHYMPKTTKLGIPYVMTGDLKELVSKIDFENAKKISDIDFRKLTRKVRSLKGDIIFARYATVGTIAYVDIDCDFTVSYSCVTIKPRTTVLIGKYLFYYLKSRAFASEVSIKVNSNIQANIGIGDLNKLHIPLPPTITEQKAIADALSDVDELIASLEKLIAKKKDIKQGAMQALLTPKSHWVTKTLRELAKFRRGSFPQPYGLSKWYDSISGTPFVQVVDVDDNMQLKKETKAKISKLGSEYSVFVPQGSIVLTIQGSIGRIAITQYDSYVDRTLLIFESFIQDFNKFFFTLSVFLKFEIEKQKAPGGIIKTITKEALSSFEISFPPIDEQNKIASIISDINKELYCLEYKLEKYKAIKQGMMQELLTGKTRLV